jgi:hypothetical protein
MKRAIFAILEALKTQYKLERQAAKSETAELRKLRKKYRADKKEIKSKYLVTMTHH